MNENRIGLKLANGELYPVLTEGTAARKRLIVTTVSDGQVSVQIDLYRGQGPSTAGAAYIGSLVIEGVPPMAKGEPDIRLDLKLAEDGTLEAYAEEASTGANQRLRVSLETLAEEETYEIPDFEFSSEGPEATLDVSFADEDFAGTDTLPAYEESARLLENVGAEAQAEAERGRIKPFAIAIVAICAVAALAAAVYFALPKAGERRAAAGSAAPSAPEPALAASPPPPPEAPAPEAAPEAAKAPEAPPAAATEPPPPPPKAEEPPAPAAPTGAVYKIKWGDTLWDLAYAFYRNPWLYPRIAKANGIRNPDLIISGAKIRIPPR